MSDSEPMMIDDTLRPRKTNRNKTRPATTRQRNLKQKFRALIRKFRLSEDVLELDSEADHDLNDPDTNPPDIDEMLDELEDLSDSGPDIDTISVMSTPKPRLRPFFTGRNTTPETELPPKSQDSHTPMPKVVNESESTVKRSESDCHTPGKALLEQLSMVDIADDRLPESLFFINTADWHGQFLAQKIQDRFHLIKTCTEADIKASVVFLVGKIQKFCNTNARSPAPIKIGLIGGDAYINSVLRPYVEHFSAKTPDWQSYIKFLLIPFGGSSIAKYLSSVDSTYSSLFMEPHWREMFDKQDSPKLDTNEIANRISMYLNGANAVQLVPIAEALIMCKAKGNDDSSSQIFIPFISEVRIGTFENLSTSTSVEIDEGAASSPVLSSSPPAVSTPVLEKAREPHTPPSSPNISAIAPSTGGLPGSSSSLGSSQSNSAGGEFMDLQVDYWWTLPKSDSLDREKDKKDKRDSSNKFSLKTTFRSLHVCRLAPSASVASSSSTFPPPAFSMVVVTKEKKQKIMRIGKKAKDVESKSQVIDGISRMVCTTKGQNVTLTVVVDGVEWHGVKFFQLSSQWQTHMKNFPVAIFASMNTF